MSLLRVLLRDKVPQSGVCSGSGRSSLPFLIRRLGERLARYDEVWAVHGPARHCICALHCASPVKLHFAHKPRTCVLEQSLSLTIFVASTRSFVTSSLVTKCGVMRDPLRWNS